MNMRKILTNIETFLQKYGTWLIFGLSLIIAVAVTYWLHSHNELLGYKDALSRLNIARGVTDSQTPGLVQLGTIWLPLFQFLMVPFTAFDYLWRTGLAGGIVSGASYVIASVYLYKLVSLVTNKRWLGVAGALVFMLNPNILYLQSVAMTELLMCATLAGTFYHLLKWIRHNNLFDLVLSAIWVALASLDRYEGWLAVIACTLIVGFEYLVIRRDWRKAQGYVILYATMAFLGLGLWFLWNLVFWGGLQYVLGGGGVGSATSGYKVTTLADIQRYIVTAFEAMRHNIGTALFAALPASLLVIFSRNNRKLSLYAMTLALIPIAFIAISISKGLPIVASADPTRAYDLRYGISGVLLAAIAVPIVINQIPRILGLLKPAVAIAAIVLSVQALPYAYNTGTGRWQGAAEHAYTPDRQFAQAFAQQYQDGKILASNAGTSLNPIKHMAQIDLKNYTWEGNYRIWERTLDNPYKENIRYIIMAGGDPVYRAYLSNKDFYDHHYVQTFRKGAVRLFENRDFAKVQQVEQQTPTPEPAATAPQESTNNTEPSEDPTEPTQKTITVQPGNSQTLIVRREVALLQEAANLNAAQKLFIETTYVSQLGRNDVILPGQTISLNLTELKALALQATNLSQTQLAAWQQYVQ